jgi:F-type H+-transporting ATPase subunit gamma
MATARDLRARMRSISQTLKITSAMRLISTAKFRRARAALEMDAPYFSRLYETVRDVLSQLQEAPAQWFGEERLKSPDHRTCYIVLTSDRGLAGGYNGNVIKLAESLVAEERNPFLITMGGIGTRYFISQRVPILEDFRCGSGAPDLDLARQLASFILSQFEEGMIDDFHIVFTRMYSAVKIVPETFRLLPLERHRFDPKDAIVQAGEAPRYDYEPSVEELFSRVIPQYIEGMLYGTLVQAYASEQSARMAAMDSASKNAREILDGLKLTYNRVRQSAITAEVSEIVSGAAALGG